MLTKKNYIRRGDIVDQKKLYIRRGDNVDKKNYMRGDNVDPKKTIYKEGRQC